MAGPNAELAEAYKRFGPAIFRRAKTLVGDEQEALDILQETFMAALREQNLLATAASPFAMLYQIATHKALDKIRHTARWSGTVRLSLPTEEDRDEAQREIERGADGQTGGARRVEAARDLAILTKGERADVMTAALLYFVEGYTTQEVGQTLDLSRKTVGKMLADFAARAQKRSVQLERAA